MHEREEGERRGWFWATLALSSLTIIAFVLALWELIQSHFFSHADYLTMHYLYLTRGVLVAVLLAAWASWSVLRARRAAEEELRRSREHYRRLLDASPGAVVLYDRDLRVMEWNATAERTYGFSREETIGRRLPILPPEKEGELGELLGRVERGETVLDVETVRQGKSGDTFEVQLSLLPFGCAPGAVQFLEVTENIRERVRMRAKLLEIEKLTSMGRMAAGTAHHLNTPLAAMLLRVQMMRERAGGGGPFEADLERLEAGIHSCKQFVQRLLDFSRPHAIEKQPVELCRAIQSVVSFLAPASAARFAITTVDLAGAEGVRVLADRNLIEALLSILLANALDAIAEHGHVAVGCTVLPSGSAEIRIRDDGGGIAGDDLARIFDPFFSTKAPGKGTGLGLAIARNIVLEHGGSIRLESRPGEGATAIVELPVLQMPASAAGGSR